MFKFIRSRHATDLLDFRDCVDAAVNFIWLRVYRDRHELVLVPVFMMLMLVFMMLMLVFMMLMLVFMMLMLVFMMLMLVFMMLMLVFMMLMLVAVFVCFIFSFIIVQFIEILCCFKANVASKQHRCTNNTSFRLYCK